MWLSKLSKFWKFSKLSKLSKKKKIILLIAALGIIATSIVTPILIITLDNDKISKKDIDKQNVQEVIKILEEKPLLEREIKLASDSKGNIIANNKTQIITKIKELIGTSNLKGVLIEISIKKDKEISTIFEKIIVEISKGNYSQVVSEDKTILVRRSRRPIELAAIDVNLVATSLKALKVKTVEVYINDASDLKITNNKNEIWEEIKKLEGYVDIDFKEVKIEIKNSNDLLPKNNESPVEITLVLSKGGFIKEITSFKAKQMSILKMAEIDVKHVKKSLENLNQKIIKVDSGTSSDHKITTNKDKIFEELTKLEGYSEIDLKEVEIKVKESEKLIPGSAEEPKSITLILSKSNFDVELTSFKVKSLSKDEIDANLKAIQVVKSSLENLSTKIVEVYIENASALEINDNKKEILNAIEKLEGYKDIEFKGINIEVKNSNDLLPANDQEPIAITLVLSKFGNSLEVTTFKAKQMSSQKIANIDVNFVKNALKSLKTKIVEINSFDSVDQKVTTNKSKILDEITKLEGYSKIDFKGVNVDVKDSENLLPKNDQLPIAITLVLSKTNALPNNIDLTIFNAKQQLFDVIVNIENKITDKNILINPIIETSNRDECLIAIRNQLKKENPTLLDEDLLKISFDNEAINVFWPLELGKRKEATLTITFNNRRKSISVYVAKGNSYLLLNSNIINGESGIIFQDDFGNLWAMGKDSKLQVLKKDPKNEAYLDASWTNSASLGLTKNSNITNGQGGTIFQDKFGNLWAMGKDSKLQVLKANENDDGYVNEGWINNNDSNSGDNLLKKSNITDGEGGIIFQDSFGNLWAMGDGSTLQVLRANENEDGYVNEGWNSGAKLGLTKNSNINNGVDGIIFQDKFKNLWAMGQGSKLQVLKVNENGNGYVNEGWINDNQNGDNLLKNSNIASSSYGAILQDSFGNLWAMGFDQKLQVLKVNEDDDGYVNEGWINDNQNGDNLLKNSNISKGRYGAIFQDDFGNLWAMGFDQKLQVLRANSQKDGYINLGWSDDIASGLTKNSNITDGYGGTIFHDEFGNLWAMAFNKKLQVLRANSQKDGYINLGWTSANLGLTKNSNITNGNGGRIFQDSFGNLWAMGSGSKLQVLKKHPTMKSYIDSWQTF